MTQEIWHTSAPRGLKPGTRGFCTVVSTQGMPLNLAERLELLSGYRHLEAPRPDGSDANPVALNHVRLVIGRRRLHVLSRIASAGLDYSGRSNKFAHHVVLEPAELPAAGPAWLLAQPGFLETRWDGQLRLLPRGRSVPRGDVQPGFCQAWQQAAGDAGWAGRLAETVLQSPAQRPRVVYLVVPRGLDVLALFAEAVALLPPEHRWEATFSTFYLPLPGDVDCRWRAVYENTPEARATSRHRGAWCLDLTRPLPELEDTPAVLAAREGKPLLLEPVSAAPMVPAAELSGSAESAIEGRPPDILAEEPRAPVPPPLVVPPPFVARRADVLHAHPPRPRRRRRPLVAALLVLGLLLLVGATGVALWCVPRLREWAASPVALRTRQHSARAPEKDTRASGPPAQETQASHQRASPGTPPASSAGHSGQGEKPAQTQPQGPAGASPPPSPPSHAADGPQAKTQAQQIAKPTEPASHQRPANPKEPGQKPKTESARAQVPSKDSSRVQWCKAPEQSIAKVQSALKGSSSPECTLLSNLSEGESLENIELLPFSPENATLQATPNKPAEDGTGDLRWDISLQGSSKLGQQGPLGQFRLLKGNELHVMLSSGTELASRLYTHIAMLHIKNRGSDKSEIALQFFPPIKEEGPLRLTPKKPKRWPLPVEFSPQLPPPQLDISSLQMAVEPEKDFREQTVQEACEPWDSSSPNSVSQYLVDICTASGAPGDRGRNSPLKAKISLGWGQTGKGREIELSTPEKAAGLSALIIKQARIFVEVKGYRVTLVEIGAEPAAKGTSPSPGGKKQGNNNGSPVKPTGL